MKSLERNKQKIYIANYQSRSDITDENGLYTGEYEIIYTAPQEVYANVSSAKGEATLDLFGTDLKYTKTIVSDSDLGIDENSVLWVEKEAMSGSFVTPYNYIVASKAKSLNSVVYAIREVDVSED